MEGVTDLRVCRPVPEGPDPFTMRVCSMTGRACQVLVVRVAAVRRPVVGVGWVPSSG